jgi:ribosome modulation factor
VTSELDQAQKRADRLYPNSKGFRGAYLAGWRAARAGRTSAACPYEADPKKTWRKAWRLAWMRGHGSHAPDNPEEG